MSFVQGTSSSQSILLSALDGFGYASDEFTFEVQSMAMYCVVNVSISGRGTNSTQQPPLIINSSLVEIEFNGANGEEIETKTYEVSWTGSTSDAFLLFYFQSFGAYEVTMKCTHGAVIIQLNAQVFY